MKITVFSVIFSLISLISVAGDNVAVKTNLIYDGLISPNVGVEMPVLPEWSVDLSVSYNPFEFSNGKMWKHWLIQPEARYWLGNVFSGHFLAVHIFGGEFNYSFDRATRRQGWAAGIGTGYGFAWHIGSRWTIEAEIALGYARYGYDKYPCASCGRAIASRNKNYFGPTKAAVSIAYRFGIKRP